MNTPSGAAAATASSGRSREPPLAAQLRRVQWTKQPKQSRGRGLSFARALRRPKQKQGTATRSSAPVFASGHCPAPRKSAKRKRHEQRPLPVAETGSCEWRSAPVFASGHCPAPRKSAKRKRAYVTASTASMCFTVLRSARSSDAPLGQRGREGVSIPPPYPLWTPYPPLNDQGMSPWTQMRKVAPGVWLKKLFTARQRYCASLFPGAIRPALRLCMRALRARLPNVPNEINEITIPRYPPKSTISTKSTKSRFHGPPTESRKQRNPRKQRNASFAGISFFSLYMDKP